MNTNTNHQDTPFTLFWTFLKLGCIAFGGPIAHLAYFRDAFVEKKAWLSESQYAELIALCQFLPGPASSQVGMALGYMRGGLLGSIAAWVGFTLPSSLLLLAAAFGLSHFGSHVPGGTIQGLKLAAFAVVVQAFWGMATSLCTDRVRLTLMILSAAALLGLPYGWMSFAVMGSAAFVGAMLIKPTLNSHQTRTTQFNVNGQNALGTALLLLFTLLMVLLPILSSISPLTDLFNRFYQTGSFVFGGGHVVLPLLETEVVATGLISEDHFLAGYGLAQAVPGPLFSFSTFLGAFLDPAGTPSLLFAAIATVSLFLPGYLLIIGILPFWAQVRDSIRAQAALAGVNAAVVGLLLAALYKPIWTHSIFSALDVGFVLIGWLLLKAFKCPSWLWVLIAAASYPLLI